MSDRAILLIGIAVAALIVQDLAIRLVVRIISAFASPPAEVLSGHCGKWVLVSFFLRGAVLILATILLPITAGSYGFTTWIIWLLIANAFLHTAFLQWAFGGRGEKL